MVVSRLSFVDKLRGLKNAVFWRSFLAVNKISAKVFQVEPRRYREVRYWCNSRSLIEEILDSNPAISRLDKEKNYFLLHASYGDKWCILSFLGEHFKLYPNSYVITCHSDRELIRIFFGVATTDTRFIFISQNDLDTLSGYFRPVSLTTVPLADMWYTDGCKMTVTPFFVDHGLPPGTIRHLHVVYYPYFNELYNLHGVSYATLMKLILYLPAAARPSPPVFYSAQDYRAAKAIVNEIPASVTSRRHAPAVLFNAVNFSQASLSLSQISLLSSALEDNGYRVLLNVSQSADSEEFASLVATRHPEAVLVSIPPTLLALVCDNVHAVIGVLGGAMNVAVQFSRSHVLSLQTPAMFTGCSEDELLGEWGKENIWTWVDQDWPCLHPGRVVVNTFIGDPSVLSDESLAHALHSFLIQLPTPEPTPMNDL